MSKRNIQSKSGKQLYLNQIFYKGMLYSSSEMQEGFAKVIDNFDIAPTGDAASPRSPLIVQKSEAYHNNKYVYPVKFKQGVGQQSYIKFKRTITEEEYVSDTYEEVESPGKTVSIISRNDNAFNTSNPNFTEQDYVIEEIKEEPDTPNTPTGPTTEAFTYQVSVVANEGIINSVDLLHNENKAVVNFKQIVNEANNTLSETTISVPTDSTYVSIKKVLTKHTANNIIDGDTFYDTFYSNNPIKTRVFGIDATEKGARWYNYATNVAINVLQGKYIDTIVKGKDIYGRRISKTYVYVPIAEIPVPEKTIVIKPVSCIFGDAIEIESQTFAWYELTFKSQDANSNILLVPSELWSISFGNIADHYQPERSTQYCQIDGTIKLHINLKIREDPRGLVDMLMKNVSLSWDGNFMPLFPETDFNVYARIDFAEYMLKAGLATPYYLTSNDPEMETYFAAQQEAIMNKRKIYSRNTDDYDPFYITPTTTTSTLVEDTTLKITEDMYIEAVKLIDHYQISPKTETEIDFVNTVYVDYLDSVAFIGRIIDKSSTSDNKIIYKGVILLRANLDDAGKIYYTVVLPSNQGNGIEPNVIDAVANGYNIINSDMLHIENEKDQFSALSILGAAVLQTKYTDTGVEINKPISIVNKATLGQNVLLKAIINEDGFYPYNEITTTDKYGYEIEFSGITYNDNGKQVQVFPKQTIVKSLGDISSIHSYEYDLSEFKKIEEYKDVTWENIFPFDGNIYRLPINKINLIGPDNMRIPLLDNCEESIIIDKNTTSTNGYKTNMFSGSLFEIIGYTFFDTNGGNDLFVIQLYDNLSAIQTTFNNAYTGQPVSEQRDNQIPFKIYSQWHIADNELAEFTPLQNPVHIFDKSAGSFDLLKKPNANAWTSEIKPTDLPYMITRSMRSSFKFTIQPKFSVVLDSETCPSALQNLELSNEFQEMSVIIPLLDITTMPELITDADLRKNLDIKNATRLDIFNRQICLYGPYTKSNVLFFSKFEKYDYFPFPYGVVEVEEPITYVYNYKDAFMVFGKNNLYMLSGGKAVGDCALHKVYENLSTHLPDIRTIVTSGNNLIFFNSGAGYVIVPNTYVDNASNIKVYKLTEYINNFFYNPEAYIRARIPSIKISSVLSFKLTFLSYVQNNNVVVVCNIDILENTGSETVNYNLPVWLIYNQDYKYWRMYSSQIFDKVESCYISEPNLNNQFLVSVGDEIYPAYFTNSYTTNYKDTEVGINPNTLPIVTMLNSGYLSVDTMNDKRFKDLIMEFDNINPESRLLIECDFFVDSAPILLSDADVIVVDKTNGTELTSEKIVDKFKKFDIYHIGSAPIESTETDTNIISEKFGTTFTINNTTYSTSGRTHVRIPVWGKGRLPSFIIKIQADKLYEFINYALIYKEKNINRRS